MWFIRMARWVRHPPSAGRVVLVFAIVAACVALYTAERFGVLPGWAALDPKGLKP